MKTNQPYLIILICFMALAACTVATPEALPTLLPVVTIAPTPTLMVVSDTPTAVPTATIIPPPATPTSVVAFVEPAPTPAPTLPPFSEHIIQDGETLDAIAAQYDNTFVQDIINASFLENPDLIYAGQKLTIPHYSAGANHAANPLPATGDQPAVIGLSNFGFPIELYTFGDGDNTLIFIGGHHGGYEWNTTVLAYELIDYLQANPDTVPTAVTLHIIPAANPDGIYAVTGKNGRITASDINVSNTFPARFNANGVDLNRNWDCDWSQDALWRDQPVDPGTAAFSEIENQILRDFITQQNLQNPIQVVVFWHSQATLVSPGSCDQLHQPSIDMAVTYARASNYPLQGFSAYEIHGDASNSLAKMGIPSFSVELTTHEATDWDRNRAGVLALLALYQE